MDVGRELSIHQRLLKLCVEVRVGTQSLDQSRRPERAGELNRQAREARDLDAVSPFQRFLDQRDPLLDCEQRLPLVGVGGNRDDHAVEDAECAVDDVEVAVGERVEAAGVDGDLLAHGRKTASIVSPYRRSRPTCSRLIAGSCCRREYSATTVALDADRSMAWSVRSNTASPYGGSRMM